MKKEATKTHTQTSRVGTTIERVHTMLEAGVKKESIAAQMSSNKIKINVTDIDSYNALWEINKSQVPITKKVEEALIKDQKQYGEARSKLKKVS